MKASSVTNVSVDAGRSIEDFILRNQTGQSFHELLAKRQRSGRIVIIAQPVGRSGLLILSDGLLSEGSLVSSAAGPQYGYRQLVCVRIVERLVHASNTVAVLGMAAAISAIVAPSEIFIKLGWWA